MKISIHEEYKRKAEVAAEFKLKFNSITRQVTGIDEQYYNNLNAIMSGS